MEERKENKRSLNEEPIGNPNIKHTEGGEMPEVNEPMETLSRIRKDMPAAKALVKSKAFYIPAAALSTIAGVGLYLYKRPHKSKVSHLFKRAFG